MQDVIVVRQLAWISVTGKVIDIVQGTNQRESFGSQLAGLSVCFDGVGKFSPGMGHTSQLRGIREWSCDTTDCEWLTMN